MSDGRSWYPGESDPRYDDPDAPQQPPAGYGGRGQGQGQGQGGDQGRAPGYGPGQRQGQGQGQGQGQDSGRPEGQGRGSGSGHQGPGRPQGQGRGSGFGQSPGYGPQRPGPGQSQAGRGRAPGYDEGYAPGYGDGRGAGRGEGPGAGAYGDGRGSGRGAGAGGYGDGRGAGRGESPGAGGYGDGRGAGRGEGPGAGAYGEGRGSGRGDGAGGYGEGRQSGYGGGQRGRGFEQGAPGRGREYPEGREGRRGGHSGAPPLDEDRGGNGVWQAPGGGDGDGGDGGATDVIEAGEGRARRRRGAAAGTGPGRQTTSASTGPSHVNEDIDLDEVDPNGRAQRAWAKQQAAANRSKSRTKAAAKWTSIGVCLVLLAVGGFGVYIYETTVGSIKHTALLPNGMTEAALPADPYGNTAQNILLIGSDTRDTTADCDLGGDCSKSDSADNVGANADSEMILHVSAEGTNATMLSIPRDTVVSLPNCSETNGVTSLTGSYSEYQINSALQYGPACQVAAVHSLTGITITGYIMFDFSGVVSMSEALGGVPVCVTAAVDDTNSGLKLPAGDSTISGNQALEFLRTRDSFFDGSDLGREEATHYFLSQLITTLRKNTNFSNLGELISIGQAASKATTVSNNYAGLSNLEGLVESLDKVPTNSIAMLTMPWEYDPDNQSRVIPSQDAASVFSDIQNDTSFSSNAASGTGEQTATATKAAAASSSPTPAAGTAASTVDDSAVPVNVFNADGVAGRAGAVQQTLVTDGFSDSVSAGDAQTVSTSQVTYDPNQASEADADAVAKALGISTTQVSATSSWQGVSVFVGEDFESGSTVTLGAASPTPSVNTSGAATAPADSHESFASGSADECIPVESGNLNMAYK
jgi:LCP family protein required for cell wall assembly